MGYAHPSTPTERAQWAMMLLAHQGTYGLVSRLSRDAKVSRQTLYTWRHRAEAALHAAFAPPAPPPPPPPGVTPRQILTLWITHASDRGIQAALRELLQQSVSLATIVAVLHEAAARALVWMQTHVPPSTRALAVDEIFTHARRGAYLNVVDVHSGAVWASEGPVPVDGDSWTLVLWDLQERGLRWDRVVMDDGEAMRAACQQVAPQVVRQLDQWHLWQDCARTQARLDRVVTRLHQQTPTVERQAARVAAGQRARGRHPKSDLAAHRDDLHAARRVAEGVRYLSGELHRLLHVVVVAATEDHLLPPAERMQELDALLGLFDEVAASSPPVQQADVGRLARRVRQQLPHLLTFAGQVAQVQTDLARVLPPAQQALIGWAWLRRRVLEWTEEDLLAALPEGWRPAARVLMTAWADAVRVSSAVERWHSILRPHLSVRRTLTSGMLAMIAVWHNHRVFTRGIHTGVSPLHLSGLTDAPTDWLVALGYPPPAQDVHAPESASVAQAA